MKPSDVGIFVGRQQTENTPSRLFFVGIKRDKSLLTEAFFTFEEAQSCLKQLEKAINKTPKIAFAPDYLL